jgi:hypothetical protein
MKLPSYFPSQKQNIVASIRPTRKSVSWIDGTHENKEGQRAPKSLVSGGLKVPQAAAAKKEFAVAASMRILADVTTAGLGRFICSERRDT